MKKINIRDSLISSFESNKRRCIFTFLSLLSAIICVTFTSLHYTNVLYGNPVTWAGWLMSIIFLLVAFSPNVSNAKDRILYFKNYTALMFLLLSVSFIISHYWNFETAPWNQNGLFDDAAWDIYFSKNHIFNGQPFQIAFFDSIGYISRETVFHYYITYFFKLFGYNLLVFNTALILLSSTTLLFTSLLIHKIFKNSIVTITSAIVLTFFPLHFLQTFTGHRYAIAAPLIMVSLYFIYSGFMDKSYFKTVIGAVFAGLCLQSAVMGKQYITGLFGAGVLYLILNFKKSVTLVNWNLLRVFVFGLVISSIPLIVYVYYNPIYFNHESEMTFKFFDTYKTNGMDGIIHQYFTRFKEVMIGQFSYGRWFSPDFATIPYAYYLFIIPGILLALRKKHYAIILLSIIPLAGAFVAGSLDMRFLHAVPFWIILMAFSFYELVRLANLSDVQKLTRLFRKVKSSSVSEDLPNIPPLEFEKSEEKAYSLTLILIKTTSSIILLVVSLYILLAGLLPSINYIHGKSEDPNSIYLLPQKDVAVSRLVRDIAAGVSKPSSEFRWQEFNKLKGIPEPNYDTLVCQNMGYAITHLFLQDYDDKEILSFSNQLPCNILSEDDILNANMNAIQAYVKTSKNLKLVWEITAKTQSIIEKFKEFAYMGSDETITSQHEGVPFSLYILNIDNKNIDLFKNKIMYLN